MRGLGVGRRAGIAPSAVRFYEETGVLPPAARRDNGYRDYADDALARLRLVVALRRLGLAPSMPAGSPRCAWSAAKWTWTWRRSSPASAPRSTGSAPISIALTPS
jgi:hypothetical protein